MKNAVILSKSAESYLVEAALNLRPGNINTLEELRGWMTLNVELISAKASDLQIKMWKSLQNPDLATATKRVLSAKIYAQLKTEAIRDDLNNEIIRVLS